MRQTGKTNYVKDLENWVQELKAQIADLKSERFLTVQRFEEKNKSQDAAIKKLEEAVDRCERERLMEKSNYIEQQMKLWSEINALKGNK